MFKNTAAKFIVFAFDATTNVPKTGDAANITAYVSKDYGSVTVLADTSATEMDATNAPGYYLFDAAQGETNGDCLLVSAKSATANIKVIGAPAIIYTRPTTGWLAPATAGRTLVVDAAGLADANMVKVGPTGSGTAQTAGDLYATDVIIAAYIDTEVGAIKTKTDFLPSATAGSAGGVMIAGSNAATTFATLTVTGASTFTGNVVLSDGLTVSAPSTLNRAGITVAGNGTGAGMILTGGATGNGLTVAGGATSGDGIATTGTLLGHGINAQGTGSGKHGVFGQANTGGAHGIRGQGSGSGAGFHAQGGSTGSGLKVLGGSTSGLGIEVTTTSGDGVSILPTAGHGIVATGQGTSKHGAILTGGGAGTSDGVSCVAGSGGVAIRGIWERACTEPTGPVAAAPLAIEALSWLNTLSRNKITQTSTAQVLKADDGSTTIATSTISDDGTTFTKGEFS